METTLEWFLGAGILTVLVAQIIVIVRSIVGWFIKTGRERKGLLRLLYTEVAQNKNIIDYVSTLLDRPNDAKSALAMRGRYVTAEAWKAARLPLAQNISSKHFAVLSDYYKNLLLLEEVVTVERERKDRDASHETNSDTLDKAKILLEALVELQSEVLERLSQRLGRGAVAAVPEEAPGGVALGDRVQRPPHRLDQRLEGPGSRPSQRGLELGEGLLDGVEVRRVGRQVEQLAAPPLDQLPDPRPLVRGEVVHHDYLPRSKRRSEHVLQVGLEDRAGGCALHGHARSHPPEAHARQQRDVAAPVMRRLAARSLSRSGPGIQRGERGVRPALVHEHEALRVDLAGRE
jgi:hypothetical protein